MRGSRQDQAMRRDIFFAEVFAAGNHEEQDQDRDSRKRRGDAAVADRALAFARSVIVMMDGKVQGEEPEQADQPEDQPAI